ncbi:MAG: DUF4430 domain-containing protein [Clostridia bacterium]|nr:DUF4430 domain-containing protein [Clostridia bacterium]
MEDELLKQIKKKRGHRLLVAVLFVAVLVIAAVSLFLYNQGSRKGTAGADAVVTLEIRCDALTKNPEALTDRGLAGYVPADGIILPTTEYEITTGETTVFDVLDRACREQEIQIEYADSSVVNGCYIEGINYLYEFSAGKYSGWMFSVDGEVPNYAANQVKLQGGERISWYYVVDYREG